MALVVPAANASAATLDRSEMISVVAALKAEVAVLEQRLANLNNNGQGMVAGISTNNGFVAYVNGQAAMQLSQANADVAEDACYLFARPSLISGDNYDCEFNGKLIFESAVDAAF